MLSAYLTLWAAALILSLAGCVLPALMAVAIMLALVGIKHHARPVKAARG